MYPVSDAFFRAVRSNTRKYFWTGTIVTKGGMTYEFGAKEILKGSGYISRQCCGSTEIELGTVYAAELEVVRVVPMEPGRHRMQEILNRNFVGTTKVPLRRFASWATEMQSRISA